jgi:hypothetical protein
VEQYVVPFKPQRVKALQLAKSSTAPAWTNRLPDEEMKALIEATHEKLQAKEDDARLKRDQTRVRKKEKKNKKRANESEEEEEDEEEEEKKKKMKQRKKEKKVSESSEGSEEEEEDPLAPADLPPGEETFVAKSVTGHRMWRVKGEDGSPLPYVVDQYKVRWEGYAATDDTWETIDSFHGITTMVDDYVERSKVSVTKHRAKFPGQVLGLDYCPADVGPPL